jgi:Cu(I)/Ag(I) efflux system membrane fusion protein
LKSSRQLAIDNWQLTISKLRLMKSLLPVAYCLLTIFSSCNSDKDGSNEDHDHSSVKARKETVYYCPMCPGQEQNEPGICKVCDMALEIKPDSSDTKEDWTLNPVNNSVLSNVKSIKAVQKSLPVTTKVSGYIEYDTRRIYTISSRIAGRVEKLYVKYNFQPVRKGEALFDIYSHELLSAQHDYLFVKKSDPENAGLINASKNKLFLLGMTEQQIENIQSKDHVHPTSTVYSPYTGYIIEKEPAEDGRVKNKGSSSMSMPDVLPGDLNENNKNILLREGAFLGRGDEAFKIVNTDVVWGIFEAYSDQLPLIRKNQDIQIKVENTDQIFMGKIDFIEPSYKEGTGTFKFRVYLDNRGQYLKIGSLLSGKIEAGEKKALWIPKTAIYDLGRNKIVFVKRDGAFETRKVTVGMSSQNEIEVSAGLSDEEEIAENAQFMIDSESFIKIKRLQD